MHKIVAVLALLAAANAVDHQATSFASFNNNHNSVHHIDSSPGLAKYAAPAAPVYAAPALTKVAYPVVGKVAVPAAPAYHSASYPQYSVSSGHAYAAPVHKVAVPVVAKYAVPVAKYASAPAYAAHQEEYAPAQYEYAYAIEDTHTGDIHSQQEHRDGDHVVGQYSLHEADGTVRIVKYSDDGHGFNAVVERQGHPTEAPVYKKVVAVAAPHYHHIFAVLALVAAANAVDHQATSFASFNNNHNSVHHIDSSPGLAKYAAPAAPVYAAPALTKVAFPVVGKVALPAAPVYHSAASPQYFISSGHSYAAPVHKVAVPVVAKYAVPVAKYASALAYAAHQEEYAPAQYEYAYAIEDTHTGDIHSQQEHRDGDHVVGQYSLHEADGTVRIVKYSDDGHGFNAVVERQGHPTEAPVYKKVVAVAAPHYHH